MLQLQPDLALEANHNSAAVNVQIMREFAALGQACAHLNFMQENACQLQGQLTQAVAYNLQQPSSSETEPEH